MLHLRDNYRLLNITFSNRRRNIKKRSLFITASATAFALVAFAANSVFCRLALGESSIDASSFTIIRLLSGAVTLMALQFAVRRKSTTGARGSWGATLMLFAYAAAFSFAYISLDTGTGALVLFGAVQLTMILVAVFTGDRLRLLEWLGLAAAFAGFVALVLPSLTTPSLT